MDILKSGIDTESNDFIKNTKKMKSLVKELNEKILFAQTGGGQEAIKRHRSRGKLLPRERINFLIRACAGMLAALLWKPNFQRYVILVAIELFALVFVFQAFPTVSQRYVDEFVSDLPIHEESPYLKAFQPNTGQHITFLPV